jgi:hypothetical protein
MGYNPEMKNFIKIAKENIQKRESVSSSGLCIYQEQRDSRCTVNWDDFLKEILKLLLLPGSLE